MEKNALYSKEMDRIEKLRISLVNLFESNLINIKQFLNISNKINKTIIELGIYLYNPCLDEREKSYELRKNDSVKSL